MAIKRIVLTTDILRPFYANNRWESATWKNLQWLNHLLGWQINKASQLPIQTISWDKQDFNTPGFYQSLGLDINYDSWASLFYEENLPKNTEEILVEPFKDSLVIGWEIPDVLQTALSRHNISFIDIISHPVRFMEDLMFGFRTNHQDIHQKILKSRVNIDDYCTPNANLLKAKVAWMPSLNLPPNTALITGQVATDKALICRKSKKFISLHDFKEQLVEICRRHDYVIFKPHPYQHEGCPSRKAISELKLIQEIKQNFYYLACQPELTDIYAINSGTVAEAAFFNSNGHHLGQSLYEFGDRAPLGLQTSAATAIDKAFLNPNFWSKILEPILPVATNLPPGPIDRPSLLRRSLNADWDYRYIDEIVQLETT